MQSLKFKFVLFLILKYTFLQSQIPGPTTNWYFGNNAGITFNSGSPVALTNGILNTTEGVATISDNAGNLLFYTDGITVYNSSHAVMTNGTGLFGDASSTQSAIIVQQPGSNNLYYIFTSDNDAGPNGICYSIVNISLNAVTVKNIPLYSPSCEKLCAIRHCNNQDVWILSHDWNANTYRSWCLTSTGITIFGWSSGSVTPTGITQSAYGQLKASSDGKRIAACYYGFAGNGANKLEISDFNASTGLVTNSQVIANDVGLYGVEFSPDNRILYASTNGGLLIQFNLCNNNSRFTVSNAGPFIGSLQLGPDGKIYVARNSTNLSVINNPNVVGVGCSYSNLSISLAGRSSRMGLPNFASYYAPPPYLFPNPTINCTTVSFTAPTQFGGCNSSTYSISWNFGDGTTSNIQNPTHTYLSPGTYVVTLSLTGICPNLILTRNINILNNGINVQIYTN